MAVASCSSFSSATIDEFTYDVFLSFRGTDTRPDFIGCLWKALDNKGIRTFFDQEDIHKGDEIEPSLRESIEKSKMALVVLSKNYASSAFCLNELSYIIECKKLVWPIFYEVEPSDVRWLENSYGEAMAKHEASSWYNTDLLEKWKKALKQVADLSGTHFKKGGKQLYKFIEEIVEKVSTKIKPFTLHVADCLVGLQPRMKDVISLLNLGSNDEIHMVGIHGIGGVGKTTLAIAVYNSIANQFQGSCYLENVRANFAKHGPTYLQKIILSETVKEKAIELTSSKQGITIIKQRLGQKKVLLVLDDVDKLEQLEAIAGSRDWFGHGSRVIITTRDTRLLTCHEVEPYEVNELNEKDAFELLKQKAIRTNEVTPSSMDVLNRALRYASGLPLALEVIGSHLFKKTVEECKYILNHYKRIPHPEIQTILEVSFDALDREEKCVFLDIACVFKGHSLTNVEKILHAHYGDSRKHHISVLIEKSLIKIDEYGDVRLHDLIADMGEEIVRQESPDDPGSRSRLWLADDIVHVLEENRGTSKIEIIYFHCLIEVKWNGEAFKKMKNLKTLVITPDTFLKSPKHLPNSLRVLEWWNYSGDVPSDFYPKKLVICKFSTNSTSFIWEGLYLSYCNNLESFPLGMDGSLGKLKSFLVESWRNLNSFLQFKLASLENLRLSDCGISLENFLPLVEDGWMGKLGVLNVICCRNHRSIPPIKYASLEKLELSCDCCRDDIEGLHWDDTSLKELPFSFQDLTCLDTLHLENCGIEYLGWIFPKQDKDEEKEIPRVQVLNLINCKLSNESLAIGLKWFANVEELDLSGSHFTTLPKCMKECHFLGKIYLNDCEKLQQIKGIPPNLNTISAFNCSSLTSSCTSKLLNQELHKFGNTNFILPGVEIPNWFDSEYTQGLSISFWFRNKFPSIALCVVSQQTCNVSLLCLKVSINGKEYNYFMDVNPRIEHFDPKMYHLWLFRMQNQNMCYYTDDFPRLRHYQPEMELIENKWNHVVVKFGFEFQKSGIYVLKENSSMEDIRFTNPEDDVNM